MTQERKWRHIEFQLPNFTSRDIQAQRGSLAWPKVSLRKNLDTQSPPFQDNSLIKYPISSVFWEKINSCTGRIFHLFLLSTLQSGHYRSLCLPRKYILQLLKIQYFQLLLCPIYNQNIFFKKLKFNCSEPNSEYLPLWTHNELEMDF